MTFWTFTIGVTFIRASFPHPARILRHCAATLGFGVPGAGITDEGYQEYAHSSGAGTPHDATNLIAARTPRRYNLKPAATFPTYRCRATGPRRSRNSALAAAHSAYWLSNDDSLAGRYPPRIRCAQHYSCAWRHRRHYRAHTPHVIVPAGASAHRVPVTITNPAHARTHDRSPPLCRVTFRASRASSYASSR